MKQGKPNWAHAQVEGWYTHEKAPSLHREFTFVRLDPEGGQPNYGTGCYLVVRDERGRDIEYCDVRYSGTTNIKTLAENWIEQKFIHRLQSYIIDEVKTCDWRLGGI